MAPNGSSGAPVTPAMPDLMVSIAQLSSGDGFVLYEAGGCAGGLTRFTCTLKVFGNFDPTLFLATIAKTLSEQRSRIVRPA